MSSSYQGKAPFESAILPKPCETWYKVFGDLNNSSTGRPLIILHGGPGACHNYLLDLKQLAVEAGVAVVFYDQVGCGNSTHLPETRLNNDIWQPELFTAELDNLLHHLEITEFDLLGQSWGGMLAATYAVGAPKGLQKLIISNSPASMELWVKACNSLRAQLPRDVDDTLTKYEELGDYENPSYKEAVLVFYKRYLCRAEGDGQPFPQDVMDSLDQLEKNDTVYFTMNGPSEFTVIGNLRHWSIIDRLSAIKNKTLILNGEFDEAQAVCVAPYTEIKDSEWKTLEGASHMSHVEKPQEYRQIVLDFLRSN